MSELPEWPEQIPEAMLWSHYTRATYERARADAAMTRLRVAVEALKEFEGFWRSGNSVPVERAVIRQDHQAVLRLYEALTAIGELPPE